jgi:hypothetical protein
MIANKSYVIKWIIMHEIRIIVQVDPTVGALSPLFVSASGSFWPPKAVADCQTLSFSASFYKIRWGKNYPKSTYA